MSAAASLARLTLGTVQFGLAYGVAGRDQPVPDAEVEQILRRAWALGIETLDTAPVYGTIEERLARLMGELPFQVVSKLPPLTLDEGSARCVADAVRSFETSATRLQGRLKTLMFHRAEDLLSPHAAAVWAALAPRCESAGVTLGVSCYDPRTLQALAARFGLGVAQLPGNALDQRLLSIRLPETIRIHLRSLFLQGLLLMPADGAARRVPAAAAALRRWHAWCAERSLPPLRAALAVVKSWPGIERFVIGLDSLRQLEDIAAQWELARPLAAPELAEPSLDATDPRRWPAREIA